MQVCNSLWIIAKIKTREMSVWAKFEKISSRENFYLHSILVASASRSSCKGMQRVLCIYTTALCGSSCWSSCSKSSQLLKLTVDTAVLCYMTLCHFCLPLSVLLLLLIIFIVLYLYFLWVVVLCLAWSIWSYGCSIFLWHILFTIQVGSDVNLYFMGPFIKQYVNVIQ